MRAKVAVATCLLRIPKQKKGERLPLIKLVMYLISPLLKTLAAAAGNSNNNFIVRENLLVCHFALFEKKTSEHRAGANCLKWDA